MESREDEQLGDPELAWLNVRDPDSVARLVRTLHPALFRYFRAEVQGLSEVPSGPALFVANHSGGFSPGDLLFLLAFCKHFGAEQPIYALAHRVFTRLLWARRQFARVGIIEAHTTAAIEVLRRGGKLVLYPGGDHDNFRPFSRRRNVDFGGRVGFLRIAHAARVPVVPVVTAGSHETFFVVAQGKSVARALHFPRFGLHSFPVTLCLPWLLLVGPFCLLPYLPLPARITVRVGTPTTFFHDHQDDSVCPDAVLTEAYQEVVAGMEKILAELYAGRRFPVIG